MSTWQTLGFTNSPYNFNPLAVEASDVDLLVGRDEESIELYTTLDSRPEGVCIISGPPGVGKTSFLNVNQFLLEAGKAHFGPRLLAARRLCPIRPEDSARDVALRALHSLHRSVQDFCARTGADIPVETKKVGDWINGVGGGGFELGLQILGCGGNYGRQVNVPSVGDVTFEGLQDVIACIAAEVINRLDKGGAFVVLDNVENLEDDQLSSLLIGFRDTLFTIPGVWWVIIGQSGLGSLIQTLDPRVSERISGKGLELTPISLDELNIAIEKRVGRFHKLGKGKPPLPATIHEHLFKASHGEIRFVFKYSETVCLQFVRDFRIGFRQRNPDFDEKALDAGIGEALI
jgi:Cdc6-like AAA superfamily ATPase